MTRLIVRAYVAATIVMVFGTLGVLTIFEAYLDEEDRRVTDQVFRSTVELAQDRIRVASDRPAEIARLAERFGFNIRLAPWDSEDWPAFVRARIEDAQVAVYVPGDAEDMVLSPFEGQILVFGPLPRFEDPALKYWSQMFAVVVGATTLAFLFFLWPVVRRIQRVQTAAQLVMTGDLSTRIQDRDVKGDALAEAFNGMTARTETILSAQRGLLQAVSHELRTPLQRLRFGLAFVEDAEDDEARQKELGTLGRELDELEGLVDELLHYVRYESDAPKLQREPVEVHTLVQRVVARHRPLASALTFDMDPSPVVVEADETALRRAVENLVANGRKYARTRVRIAVKQTGETVALIVEDDGPGIPADQRTRILRPFVKLDPSMPGTGLGLALVDRIARAHDARVTIDASPLGGAQVTIQNLTVSVPKPH